MFSSSPMWYLFAHWHRGHHTCSSLWLNYWTCYMLLGYIRISKSDGSQSLDLQRDVLLATGVAPDRIYEDLASGRHDTRPGLEACLKALRPQDTLVVWKLDRLGRNLRHLVTLVETLHQREVELKVVTSQGAQIDTTTVNGRLVFGIFAALAEFEAELIRERTRAGLAAARARGRRGGRPRKVTKAALRMAMAAMVDREANAAEVAQHLGIARTTLYLYLNGDGSPKALGQALLSRGAGTQCCPRSRQPSLDQRSVHIWRRSARAAERCAAAFRAL